MKQYRAVHQFHSGTAPADAVTQQMLSLRQDLLALGYESEIYAEHIDPRIAGEIRPLNSLGTAGSQLLLWHHSMGNDGFDRAIQRSEDVVAVYHNVTPEEYFDDYTSKYYSLLGREQLRFLARKARVGIADSNYNRKEMLDVGFRNVAVLPPRTDFRPLATTGGRCRSRSGDWLFVGRVVPNKRQHELVSAFAAYSRSYDPAARLRLVGDTSYKPYVERVLREVARLGLSSRVDLLGKVPEGRLAEMLQTCGIYVSLSEHEGFGVPLLEAMAAGLPVVAYAAAAVPETMGGAGILLRRKDRDEIAALAWLLHRDAGLRERLVARQFQRVRDVERFDVRGLLERVTQAAGGGTQVPEVQVQGPFETSYSLAITNRQLALGLAGFDDLAVSIYATEGPGDYEPDPDDLAAVPEATALYRRSRGVPYPDVVIRQMWPPRVIDSPGAITCSYFGWEESLVPRSIVEDFNRYVDGIGAMSTFVRDALRESGVSIPIAVVGNGVDAPDPTAVFDGPEVGGLKAFRFLHISSAFPRKGVDALLGAYFDAFDGRSDVSLILKTFPNPHNEVARILEELRGDHPDPPDVRWIDRDLSRAEVDGLYGLAHCYVHPARGEGFGLPIAEAMLAGVPVISLEYSGMADFVSGDTAWTVPYSLEPARSHLHIAGSVWAEPDHGALVEALRTAVREQDAPETATRVKRARSVIEDRFSWGSAAGRWHDFLRELQDSRSTPRVAVVSTWNSKCGIAEYSKYLMTSMPVPISYEVFANRGVEVVDDALEIGTSRCWWDRWKPDLRLLRQELEMSGSQVVHFQFNYGFFELEALGALIEDIRTDRGVVVTLHRTSDAEIDGETVSLGSITDKLALADRLIVHQPSDLERLEAFGLGDNVELIEHGAAGVPPLSVADAKSAIGLSGSTVVATFGFLLPHKGTLRLVGLLDRLKEEFPDVVLLALTALHPDPISRAYAEQVTEDIARRGLGARVRLITDYLPDRTARAMLRAADVIVLPYDPTEESASGSARFVLPTGRPVIASSLPIFSDLADALLTYPPGDDDALLAAVRRVLADPSLGRELARKTAERAARARWDVVAAEHLRVYQEAWRASRRRREPGGSG